MKPAREPASSRPKHYASLKKPHESCLFAVSCGPRKNKKNTVVGHQLFPQKPPGSRLRFSRTGVQHSPGSSTIELHDRASLRLCRIWCVPTRYSATRLSATVLPASRCRNTSRRAPNSSSEEVRAWEHHPQPTIPPPRLNR